MYEIIHRLIFQVLFSPLQARQAFTPLLQGGLDDEECGGAIKTLPIPTGGFGLPETIAKWIKMMLSDAADFMCGSVVVIDGGSDALIRPDDWPKSFTI